MVEDTVGFAIESSDTGRLLLPVCAHVGIVVVLVAPRTLLLLSRLDTLLEQLLIHVLPSTRYHTTPTQSGGPRRSAQRCAIRALTPQYRRFVLVPIALSEFEATVLRPEEEPYAAQDEKNANESKESEEGAVVDVVRVNGAGTRIVWCGLLSCDVSGSKVRSCLERGESVGAFNDWSRYGGRGVSSGEEDRNVGRERSHGGYGVTDVTL